MSSGENVNPFMLGDCIPEWSNPSGASIARGSSPKGGIWFDRPNEESRE